MILVSGVLVILLMTVLNSKPVGVYVVETLFLSTSGKDVCYVMFWDFFSWLFILTVLLIASVVFVYSSYYMDGDKSRLGFMLLLFSFVVSMILLLISPNFISLLLGWDGLGVTSYLLVIYYSSASSSVAGMLTFLTNRLGDVFFLFTVGVMSFLFEWEKFVLGSAAYMGIFLVVACITKSAQVPFSSWLPAAMAAPTPVSSLVHSSTLVTAGLYLMIRFQNVLMKVSIFIFFLGSITLVIAGLMAVFEWDLKKLIAFSTLSQLGFMVSAFSLGLVWMSFFHLVTHALFKASLFLSAGVLIHNADSSQEFRNMFSVSSQLFWVVSIINICLLCLCGIPFTSGFYSKDLIIDSGQHSFVFLYVFLLGVVLTVSYSFRFFSYSFRQASLRGGFNIVYEKVFFIMFPLLILLVAALVGGWFFFECFFSFMFWTVVTAGWKSFYFFLLAMTFMFSGLLSKLSSGGYLKNFFLGSLAFLKLMFSSKSLGGVVEKSSALYKSGDQGSLESAGPQGIFISLFSTGKSLFSFQSFVVTVFLLLFIFSFFFF